jgi:outer membrane protein insertion porin family
MNLFRLKYFLVLLIFLASCTIIRKAPKNKPYQAKKPTIDLIGGQFTKLEREAIKERLYNALDDSAKVTIKESFLFFKTIKNPIAFDTNYAINSALNMRSSMHHLGYYNAQAKYDTVLKGKQVITKYTITAGNPTLIDTFNYRLKIPELQNIAYGSKNVSLLQKKNIVTKIGAISEVSRLVDSFRNNGYYKFTASELRILGDSSIEALTNLSDDPFDQLRLLEDAQKKRDSPTIKLAIVLNYPADSSKLYKYYINKIYVLSDYRPNDKLSDTTTIWEETTKNFIHRYHQYIFKNSLLDRNITIHSGDFYKQDEYNKTLNNLSKLGVWQNINIKIIENFDKVNNIDLVIELVPSKKINVGGALDASYSSANITSSGLGGNLFGLSAEFSVENKNIAREAIKMKNSIRGGIEFNNKNRTANSNNIYSNEVSYNNSLQIPRLLWLPNFLKTVKSKNFISKNKYSNAETFISTNLAYSNRLDFFNLQSVNIGFGWAATTAKDWRIQWRPINTEFSYLYNQTPAFDDIIARNQFLRYSYNTSFVLGMTANAIKIKGNRVIKFNFDESGIIPKNPILKDFKKKYIKFDVEYKNLFRERKKSNIAFRGFFGIGIPLYGDSSLPFFKQYFAGGSNSMRGWPVRGIGRGGQKLPPLATNLFNDRTGDMQVEFNIEHRHQIAVLLRNFITLKGALFCDIGNVWNIRNTKGAGSFDETVFTFNDFAKQIGLSGGYGFRVDFTYAVLRFDFGFRFKRPETSDVNNGWKYPDISFKDGFQKILSKNFRDWRYENFNFSVGINYPF